MLVVDDDAAMRKLFGIYLNSFGYRVLVARDGDEAVRFAAEHPDLRLVLMDVVMSGLSGQQLASKMKALLPDIRILFCSGHPAKALTSHGLDFAASQFLQKPCHPTDLQRALNELLANA